MPHPCIGSSASVFRINKSSVPCNRSVDGGIPFPSAFDNRFTPFSCRMSRGQDSCLLSEFNVVRCDNLCQSRRIWCQRRDSNSQTPVSKTGCYSNSHTLALWCTGEDLNLRVPLGETGLQPVRFGRAHAPVQTWRKVGRIERPRLSTIRRLSGPVADYPAVPSAGGAYGTQT